MFIETRLLVVLTIVTLVFAKLGDRYVVDLLASGLAFGLLAAAADLGLGRCGVPNLGPALPFGLGAYFCAWGLVSGRGMGIGMLCGLAASMTLAAVVGGISLRPRSARIQFGLIGLVLSLTAEQLAVSLYDLAGGSNGIPNVPRPILTAPGVEISLADPRHYLIFVAAVSAGLVYVLLRLAGSHAGRVMVCVRDDATKAESLGYSSYRVRFGANLVTTAVSAVAGGLFVPISGIAHPGLFGVRANMLVLVWVAIGGTGTIVGPYICAIALKLIEAELGSRYDNVYLLVLGAIFVAIVLYAPDGFAGRLRTFLASPRTTET